MRVLIKFVLLADMIIIAQVQRKLVMERLPNGTNEMEQTRPRTSILRMRK